MRTIGLVVPAGRDNAMFYAVLAAEYLQSHGIMVCAEKAALHMLPGCLPMEESPAPDAIVTLGGDGTLLRGAQYAIRCGAMLLGINLGQIGFLAETEPGLLEEALEALLRGQFSVEERPMLEVTVAGKHVGYAMNDAVLTRGGYARLITVRAIVDGEEAACYRADGLIVATPTGSTGYSLSAGGPVISPKVDCMVITPVCAHSLQHRPVIVDGAAKITLELGADVEMTALLQVDGQNRLQMHGGQKVEIVRSDARIRLVRLQEARFFGLVRQKLAEWSS